MKSQITSLLVCFLMATGLGACSGGGGPAARCDHSLPEDGKWQTPLYPAAQQVQTSESATYWQRTTTYVTPAAPATILSFYEGTLAKTGWQLGGFGTPQAGQLSFQVANCCNYLSLAISAWARDDGLTQVMIKYNASIGCG